MFRFFISPKTENTENKPNQDIYTAEELNRELLSPQSPLKGFFEALSKLNTIYEEYARESVTTKPELGLSPRKLSK